MSLYIKIIKIVNSQMIIYFYSKINDIADLPGELATECDHASGRILTLQKFLQLLFVYGKYESAHSYF